MAGIEDAPEQTNEPQVPDATPHAFQQQLVVDNVEEAHHRLPASTISPVR